MPDRVKRWITHNSAFRVLVADSTETVRAAAEVANAVPEVTDMFGRLVTGVALFQLAQAPLDRVQCALHHTGMAGELLAEARPGPFVRGRVEYPRPEMEPYLADPSTIQVSRVNPRHPGKLYQSVVPVTSGSI
ncbi:MAG: Hsp33 family molecular chaperone HslO, partial [Myxococcales bacterium]|nr:Hsp33 family molecular chaperone HslO [Myxococcales bacterium]